MTGRYLFADPDNEVKDIFSPVSISQATTMNMAATRTPQSFIFNNNKKSFLHALHIHISLSVHFPSVLILSTIGSLGKDGSNGNAVARKQ